jgi:sterol desaturase/sphingolipid hydroxylase (fatty acid hydroxylase superfamily)
MSSQPYQRWFLLLIAVSILLEISWNWRRDKHIYHLPDTLANLGVLVGFQLSKFLQAGYFLSVLGWLYHYRFFTLPDTYWTLALTFLVTDLAYYWFHRLSHHLPVLWAFHAVHHSSPYMNLTTAYRLNWFGGLIAPLFYLPLVVIGFPPTAVVMSLSINLLYQFFCHTQAIGSLGWVDQLLDTPSNHRVHHGTNPAYLDRNFGGILMIWDRLFGTYTPETEAPQFGLTTGFVSNNPFVLVFHGFREWWRR